MKPFKTIDLRRSYYNIALFSRLIWQELFDQYEARGGDLRNMDSLLCDYDRIKVIIEKNHNATVDIWWAVEGPNTDLTEAYEYDDSIRIRIDMDQRQVEFFEAYEGEKENAED